MIVRNANYEKATTDCQTFEYIAGKINRIKTNLLSGEFPMSSGS